MKDAIHIDVSGFYFCSDDEDDWETYDEQVQIYRENVSEKVWKKLIKNAELWNDSKHLLKIKSGSVKLWNDLHSASLFFQNYVENPWTENSPFFTPSSLSRDGTVEEFEINNIIVLSDKRLIDKLGEVA